MTRRVAVLGAGRVGGLIARDVAAEAGVAVTSIDCDAAALARVADGSTVATDCVDVADDAALARALAPFDLIVGAVPGRHGDRLLAAAIAAGKPTVDISFSPEDPLRHDAAARAAGVPVVVDCGVAPGLSNWLVGRSTAELDRVDRVEILVGGLPEARHWPFEYRSVFSPTDVIEEYTRPTRKIEHGARVTVPALGGRELVEFDGIGTLEAFDTDGLRTLLETIPARSLVEKTLRYPGHAERMAMLRESGFFEDAPLELPGGIAVRPRALTEALLFRAWAPRPGDREFTALRVTVTGESGGRPAGARWEMVDRTDPRTGTTSMARTTGFPCAIVARMLLDGRIADPGVHPPERLGADAARTGELLEALDARGVRVRRTELDADGGRGGGGQKSRDVRTSTSSASAG